MITAYRLYTGPDGHSHVERGTVAQHQNVDVHSIHFEETPAHSALEWHNAPTTQYVITLSGVLDFWMRSDDRFTLHPGEILIAVDTTGSGHCWKLTNNDPWRRAYVTFKSDTMINFVPD